MAGNPIQAMCGLFGTVLVFAVCIAVIAVFTDAIAGVSKVDFAAFFTVIAVGLHCICCDCSHSCCEGQKQQQTVKTNTGLEQVEQ